LIKNGQVLN